jgi:hypothetical protein
MTGLPRYLSNEPELSHLVLRSLMAMSSHPPMRPWMARRSADKVVRHSAACATSSPNRTPRTTYSAATLMASIMLTALALPVPAMSNAVP